MRYSFIFSPFFLLSFFGKGVAGYSREARAFLFIRTRD